MNRHLRTSLAALLVTLLGCAGSTTGGPLASRSTSPSTSNVEAYPVEHLAVRSLIERFADAANHQDWQTMESLFTEDAVWEVKAAPPMGWTFEGRNAIREGMTGNTARVELRVMSVTPIVVHVQGPERATARSTLDEVLRVRQTGKDLRVVGTYSDQLVKQDGQWRFARRTFEFRYEEELGTPTGDAR
ncbi:nuclear transport factor 2 family protein [Myxococcus faecalis]|uniref:nuclear transport factor 2 family protein n=1 Tax=Myxococcus faecalis TaxID=3115646 RepID=UPI0024C9E2F5|nr:nuclear transport factor 2 family protein [Myxococcus sp. MH1]